jgi:transcriptional regulator with XRE-family HTH domain
MRRVAIARKSKRGRRHGTLHPHPVDMHVGSRVRLSRAALGMSQEKLGDAIGVAFQQIQKYESGANRIGASRLYEISRALRVPIAFFFEEIEPELLAGTQAKGMSNPLRTSNSTVSGNRNLLKLARIFQNVSDEALLQKLFDLVKTVADTCEASGQS